MNPIFQKILLFQVLILLPFAAGQIARHFTNEIQQNRWTGFSFRISVFLFDTMIGFLIFWIAELKIDDIFLPLGGLTLVLLGLVVGHFYAKIVLRPVDLRYQATFALGVSLGNHGYTMGGATAFLLFGLEGMIQAMVYVLYFFPTVFTVFFAYGEYTTKLTQNRRSTSSVISIRELVWSKKNLPLMAIFTGLLLNLFDVPAPPYTDTIILSLVGFNMILVYASFGFSMRFSSAIFRNPYLYHLSLLKFILLPAFMILLYWLLRHFWVISPLNSAIWILQAFMPAAVYSVILSRIFSLHHEHAHDYFIGTTLVYIILILPILYTTLSLLF